MGDRDERLSTYEQRTPIPTAPPIEMLSPSTAIDGQGMKAPSENMAHSQGRAPLPQIPSLAEVTQSLQALQELRERPYDSYGWMDTVKLPESDELVIPHRGEDFRISRSKLSVRQAKALFAYQRNRVHKSSLHVVRNWVEDMFLGNKLGTLLPEPPNLDPIPDPKTGNVELQLLPAPTVILHSRAVKQVHIPEDWVGEDVADIIRQLDPTSLHPSVQYAVKKWQNDAVECWEATPKRDCPPFPPIKEMVRIETRYSVPPFSVHAVFLTPSCTAFLEHLQRHTVHETPAVSWLRKLKADYERGEELGGVAMVQIPTTRTSVASGWLDESVRPYLSTPYHTYPIAKETVERELANVVRCWDERKKCPGMDIRLRGLCSRIPITWLSEAAVDAIAAADNQHNSRITRWLYRLEKCFKENPAGGCPNPPAEPVTSVPTSLLRPLTYAPERNEDYFIEFLSHHHEGLYYAAEIIKWLKEPDKFPMVSIAPGKEVPMFFLCEDACAALRLHEILRQWGWLDRTPELRDWAVSVYKCWWNYSPCPPPPPTVVRLPSGKSLPVNYLSEGERAAIQCLERRHHLADLLPWVDMLYTAFLNGTKKPPLPGDGFDTTVSLAGRTVPAAWCSAASKFRAAARDHPQLRLVVRRWEVQAATAWEKVLRLPKVPKREHLMEQTPDSPYMLLRNGMMIERSFLSGALPSDDASLNRACEEFARGYSSCTLHLPPALRGTTFSSG